MITASQFWDRVDMSGECWIWKGNIDSSNGYGRVALPRQKQGKAHRIAYELHYGVSPTDCVLHRCDNPPCVRPSHLFMGSRADNNQDRHQKGRSGSHRGIANGRAKLNEESVAEIRRMYVSGDTQTRLASMFGVTPSMVGHIVRGEAWV